MGWLGKTQVVSGFGSALEKWVFIRQVQQGFSSFLPYFGHICDDFSQHAEVPNCQTLKNHQICHKFGEKKNEEKPGSTRVAEI